MIALAWAMLALWPAVAWVLFQRHSLPVAVCATIIGGFLFLPNGLWIDVPVLPRLQKNTIPTVCALIFVMVFLAQPGRKNQPGHDMGWIPRDPVVLCLLAALAIGPFGTVFTNADTLVYGPRVIGPLRVYDAFAIALEMLMVILPMLIARRVFVMDEDRRVLLIFLAGAALVYSVPVLWEVRMSPQLHKQIYGFFPHSFMQHMRGDGFRPLVFMNHGLTLGIFLTVALVATASLTRLGSAANRVKWWIAAAWLAVVLVLAKSLGALLIALVLIPIILFLSPRIQVLAAAAIAVLLVSYPVIRATPYAPTDQILSLANDISPMRARSFEVRVRNEEILLDKAMQRPFFGWGGWGRNRVIDSRGRDLSITDGAWIEEIGRGGWVRYATTFGLLCWPILGLFLFHRQRIDPVSAALALALSAKLVDLIPNSGLQPVYWMIAGALLAKMERGTLKDETSAALASPLDEALTTGSVYARGASRPRRNADTAEPVRYARQFDKVETEGGPSRNARGRPTLHRTSATPNGGARHRR